MSKIVIETINDDVDLDKLVTFISEKFKQDKIQFKLEMHDISSNLQHLNHTTRSQFDSPIYVGCTFAIKVMTRKNILSKQLDKYMCEDKKVIYIEPKGGFGTGTHPTTQMCVQMIEKYCTPDASVLDIGCGSGILSIVASKLGAKHVTGIDISEAAVLSSIHNADINNLSSDTIEFKQLELQNMQPSVQCDVIVANLLTDTITTLLPDILKNMHTGSKLIVSGIPDFRYNEMIDNLKKYDLVEIEHIDKDNWICIVANLNNNKQ